MPKNDVIPFPKTKLFTPAEREAFNNDYAHQLLQEFIDTCFIDDNTEQRIAFTQLRENVFTYMDDCRRKQGVKLIGDKP